MRRRIIILLLFLLSTTVCLPGCGDRGVTSSPEVVMVSSATLPLDPGDPAWRSAPDHRAPLLLQDMVEPRLTEPSTAEVRVRVLQNGVEAAFRLEWDDSTQDNQSIPSRFSDACAIQIPTDLEANLPAPQMGEAGRRVEITYWNAAWQASVDGRGDALTDIYPNASIDHYPFEAASLEAGSEAAREMALRYAPARRLGNLMGGPRQSPVEDLIAEGPGTLTPAAATTSKGNGSRTRSGWSVVIIRRMPEGMAARSRSQIAFAVWEGAHGEVGARKMRTGWLPMVREERP